MGTARGGAKGRKVGRSQRPKRWPLMQEKPLPPRTDGKSGAQRRREAKEEMLRRYLA